MQIVEVPFFEENNSPAKVYKKQGIIIINKQEFDLLPDFAKKWVIEHEKGHYYLQTDDEILADRYATEQLAGSEPGSLMKLYDALTSIAPQVERHAKLAEDILIIAAQKGSEKAKQILLQAGLAEKIDKHIQTSSTTDNSTYSLKELLPTYLLILLGICTFLAILL